MFQDHRLIKRYDDQSGFLALFLRDLTTQRLGIFPGLAFDTDGFICIF